MATLEARIIALAQAIGTDVKTLRTAIGVLSGLSTNAKTSLVAAINEVASVANTNDSEIGNIAALTTTAKSNLVVAINEIKAALGDLDLSSIIDDDALAGDTAATYSADKIIGLMSALETKIMGGITTEALDTIKELADFLTDHAVAGGLLEQMGNRVRVDAAQSFDSAQQAQARANIGAASATTLQTLTDNVGNTDHDFAADYTIAKT